MKPNYKQMSDTRKIELVWHQRFTFGYIFLHTLLTVYNVNIDL